MSEDELQHPKMFFGEDGTLFLNFGEYGRQIELASFSGDGTKLLAVKEVGTATIVDAATQSVLGEIRPTSPLAGIEGKSPFTGPFRVFIESVALNHDGSLALLGLNDGTAGIYSTQDGSRLVTFCHPGTQPAENWCVIRTVNFSPDGSLALVGFPRRSVGVWRTLDHTLIRFLTTSNPDRLFKIPFVRDTFASSVAASQDNQHIFAGFADMTAALWNLESGEVSFEAVQHAEDILNLWIDNQHIRWATTGGSVWESMAPTDAALLLATGESWTSAQFSSDGERLMVRTLSGAIKQWSIDGNSESLVPDNFYLSEVFHLSNAQTEVYGKKNELTLYVAGEKQIAICTQDNTIYVDHPIKVQGLAVSPLEDIMATWGQSKSIELWHVPEGQHLHSLAHNDGVGSLCFSADGNLLAVGVLGQGGPGAIRPVYVWDVDAGKLLCELKGHTHQVHALAFYPDGNRLVSASLDRTVRLWDLSHKMSDRSFEISCIRYDDLDFYKIAVLSNGRMLIFRRYGLEVWNERKLLEIPIPWDFRSQWHITEDEKSVVGSFKHQIIRTWSLETGQEMHGYQSDITRPESLPSAQFFTENFSRFQPRAGGYLWRTSAGNFVHVGDGPRGWVTPLTLHHGSQCVVLPGLTGAAVIDLQESQRLIALLPFEGMLRASCILPDQIRMLNSSGKLFNTSQSVYGNA
jgi:WD40 repeat protein